MYVVIINEQNTFDVVATFDNERDANNYAQRWNMRARRAIATYHVVTFDVDTNTFNVSTLNNDDMRVKMRIHMYMNNVNA